MNDIAIVIIKGIGVAVFIHAVTHVPLLMLHERIVNTHGVIVISEAGKEDLVHGRKQQPVAEAGPELPGGADGCRHFFFVGWRKVLPKPGRPYKGQGQEGSIYQLLPGNVIGHVVTFGGVK
ncbi:hypothetical protein FQZ97_917130 [compost metagenome]